MGIRLSAYTREKLVDKREPHTGYPRNPAATALRVWCAQHPEASPKEMALVCGVHQMTILYLRNGRRRAGPRLAAMIEQLTSGAVPATLWRGVRIRPPRDKSGKQVVEFRLPELDRSKLPPPSAKHPSVTRDEAERVIALLAVGHTHRHVAEAVGINSNRVARVLAGELCPEVPRPDNFSELCRAARVAMRAAARASCRPATPSNARPRRLTVEQAHRILDELEAGSTVARVAARHRLQTSFVNMLRAGHYYHDVHAERRTRRQAAE